MFFSIKVRADYDTREWIYSKNIKCKLNVTILSGYTRDIFIF